MPTISMFYGILILMFLRDNRRHHLPHIHVRYQGEEAVVSIEDGSVHDGALPAKQLKDGSGMERNSQGRVAGRLGTSHQWRRSFSHCSPSMR